VFLPNRVTQIRPLRIHWWVCITIKNWRNVYPNATHTTCKWPLYIPRKNSSRLINSCDNPASRASKRSSGDRDRELTSYWRGHPPSWRAFSWPGTSPACALQSRPEPSQQKKKMKISTSHERRTAAGRPVSGEQHKPLPGEPARRSGLAASAPRRSASRVERRRGDDGLAMGTGGSSRV
jgi:hypothetical protein